MTRFGNPAILCLLLGLAVSGIPVTGASSRVVSPQPGVLPAGDAQPAAGRFLVARRSLGDRNFARSVVYLVAHDDGGTLGLIVNRPSGLRLSEAVPDIEAAGASDHALYFGGPVDPSSVSMLMRGEKAVEGVARVDGDIYIGSERGAIESALAGDGAGRELRFFFGYSGWAPGQLDSELLRGSWYVVAADPGTIFADDGLLWERLIEGLDPPGIEVRHRLCAPCPPGQSFRS